MEVKRTKASSLTTRIWESLTRDKPKSALLAILASILAVSVAREALQTPSKSVAAPSGNVLTGTTVAISMDGLTRDVSADAADAVESWQRTGRSARKITRDLFAVNEGLFPPVKSSGSVVVIASGDSGDQSVNEQTHNRQVVQAQAKALVLQSTVISDSPIAIINGRILKEGDWINGFETISITSRGCTLTKRGVKVFLEMDN